MLLDCSYAREPMNAKLSATVVFGERKHQPKLTYGLLLSLNRLTRCNSLSTLTAILLGAMEENDRPLDEDFVAYRLDNF